MPTVIRRSLTLVASAVSVLIAVPTFAQFDQQGGPAFFDGVTSMGPYAWVAPGAAANPVIPPGTTMAVCRGWFPTQSAWHPGKYLAGNCNVAWGTQEVVVPISQGVQILNFMQPDKRQYFPQNWIEPNDTVNAGFIGGTVGGVNMRVCKVQYTDGIHSGKEWEGACWIGWGGKAVSVVPYLVLSLYNGEKLDAAITKQTNAVDASGKTVMTLELVTITPYPTYLTGGFLVTPSGADIQAPPPDTTACSYTPGVVCKARYTWTVPCAPNGNYKVAFYRNCQQGAYPCGGCQQGGPSCSAPIEQWITLSLQGEGLCSTR